MTIIFATPFVVPSDIPGMSFWLNAHYLEHIQFVSMILNSSPGSKPVLFDLGVWPQRRNNPMFNLGEWDKSVGNPWLDNHQEMHNSLWQILGPILGNNGNDLTQVDPDDEANWRNWEELHAIEHNAFRVALGIT